MFRLEIYKRVEASEEEAAAAFEGDCENAQNPIIHFYAERIFCRRETAIFRNWKKSVSD